jgi:endonuclease YncB( thermonuclease family)
MISPLLAASLILVGTVANCSGEEVGSPTSQPAPDKTIVSKVTDGDTFELSTGHKIRVLGIDSCEKNTPGGVRALEQARTLLLGQEVFLEWEGDTDLDPYNRHLRYVLLRDGRDFAEVMVVENHTEAYKGGDASRDYQNRMLVLDTPPRICEE